MRKLASLVVVCVLGGTAAAGPTVRFGMTFGADRDADVPLLGPAVALGYRAGPIVVEGEWAWLSFLDGLASQGGVHRLGVTLRAELARHLTHCMSRPDLYACTHAKSFYIEAGAAERFGQFMDTGVAVPRTSPWPELHVGGGIELDNKIGVSRHGWQFGLRLAVAHNDGAAMMQVACRTATGGCTSPGGPATTDLAVLAEWMYLLGH
jgi:hypothetical protein